MRIVSYDSQSPEYHRAFEVFLANTDQKVKARAWLDRLVDSLPARDVFIDAGAGNGQVTAWYTGRFLRTIAIEPNPSLCEELRAVCSSAEVMPTTILHAKPGAAADLVLCSHVFYYIEQPAWMDHLVRLASWLSRRGVLVAAIQNHGTDCMQMLDHFCGKRFDLPALAEQFRLDHGGRYRVECETVPARVATRDPESAYTVAEFMLNLLPLANPPMRHDVADYVRQHFADGEVGFRFSCDQDFVRIAPQ